jgi:THO complex subunit 3
MRARPLRKDLLPTAFKNSKTQIFSETPGGRATTTLAPNIRSISWSPTGALLAHSTSVNIRVWNPERPEVRASTELRDSAKGGAHGKLVERIEFNPCVEGLLASTGVDGMVKIWDVRMPGTAAGAVGGAANASARGATTGKAGEYKLGDEGLFLTWHPDGTQLLIGRRDDIVHAVDIRRSNLPLLDITNTAGVHTAASTSPKYDLLPTDRTPAKQHGNFNQMTFSNSGRQLFATTHDGPVVIFDYPSMQPIYTIRAHARDTYAVKQSPLGTTLAIGAGDSTTTLWDTSTWLCEHVLTQHTSAVRDLSFSFDGAYLVAGAGPDAAKDGDKGLAIYHVDTGELAHTVDTVNPVTWAAWHPHRYAVAHAGDPGGLKVVGPLANA